MSTILVNNVKSYTGSTVTISGSNIAVQGNTTLGDNSGNDTITVNGHITASGNISASGTVFASNFKSAGASGEAMTFNDNVDLDGTFTMDGATFDVNATGAVTIDSVGLSIDNVGVAANITSTTDGNGEDFTIALAGATNSSLILSSTGTSFDALKISASAGSIAVNSADNITVEAPDNISIQTTSTNGELTITSSHAAGKALHISAKADVRSILDIDAGILDIDALSTASITSTGNNTGAILLHANGGVLESIKIHSDQGTGAGSIELTSDAGSIDINSGDDITMDAADEIIVTTTSADGHIALVSAHTAGQAIHLDGNANPGSIVDIDAGILDIDVTAAATLDAVGIALGAGSGELDLTTTGLMDINSAALDIDTSGAVTIDAAGAASDIKITTAHTAGVAFHLDANADAASEVQIDAGVLDIDVTAAATIDAVGVAIGAGSGELDLTTTGTMDINSAALDIDTSGAITIDAAGAASHVAIVTAHTAGQAFHLDANADVRSIVDIDAGILDIDAASTASITSTGNNIGAILLHANGGVLESIKIHSDQGTGAGSIELTSDAGSIDINSGDNITVDAADDITVTADNVSIVANTTAAKLQSPATALTATDAGIAIPVGTAVALINADSDANHIVILPAPVVGNIIHIIETATTGYELRSSTPGSIGINGGTGSNVESAIAGAITYIRCVCVSSTSWIATQFDADGDESKVEAAA